MRLASISMSSIMQTFSSLTKGLSWNQYPTESTTTNVQTPAPCGTTSEVASVAVAEANDAEPDWLREAGNRVLETSPGNLASAPAVEAHTIANTPLPSVGSTSQISGSLPTPASSPVPVPVVYSCNQAEGLEPKCV